MIPAAVRNPLPAAATQKKRTKYGRVRLRFGAYVPAFCLIKIYSFILVIIYMLTNAEKNDKIKCNMA